MKDYDENDLDKIDKCRKKAFQLFLAFLYMDNSDKQKYGTLLTGLQTQQSLGNNQYPKNITEANSVLSNHRLDNAGRSNRSQTGSGSGSKKDSNNEVEKEEKLELSFLQMEGKCYCCGKTNHKSPQCRFKSKPKEEWYINVMKAKMEKEKSEQSHAQPKAEQKSNTATETVTKSEQSTTTGWAGAHVYLQFYQAEIMKDVILLDNQSSASIFCNPDFVYDVREVDEELVLLTNGGEIRTKQKATVPDFGEVWFNPKAITNIFCFADMENSYKITHDTSSKKAFIVYKKLSSFCVELRFCCMMYSSLSCQISFTFKINEG
jgi:hypothetical protein